MLLGRRVAAAAIGLWLAVVAACVVTGAQGSVMKGARSQTTLGASLASAAAAAEEVGAAMMMARADPGASAVGAIGQQPVLRPDGLLNYNSTCTFAYKNSGATAREATALLYATRLVLEAKASVADGQPAGEFELPLRSVTRVFDNPPGSFVVRSTRGAMRCLYIETSRVAPPKTPPGPWTLCFSSLALRLRWSAELRFATELQGSLDARHFREGRLTLPIAASFLVPPVGISTGRPFFATAPNTICAASSPAQCLAGNVAIGSVGLAAPAWSNAFPKPLAVPQQRWRIYPTGSGGGGGDALQICQPNDEAPEAQDLCLSAMRAPSDDFTGHALAQPGTVRGDTVRERQAKLDEWRVFTSCEGGDYRCFVVESQVIGGSNVPDGGSGGGGGGGGGTLNDARVCQRACTLDPACDGWTHTLPGVGNMREGRCCLKQRQEPTEPLQCVNDECCTSGLKPRVEIIQPPPPPADQQQQQAGGGDGSPAKPEVDKSLDAAGVQVLLSPRNVSSTRRWQLQGGAGGGGGTRIVYVFVPSAADGDTPLPGDENPLCLTLTRSVQTVSSSGGGGDGGRGIGAGEDGTRDGGAHVGLLPCVDGGAAQGDVVLQEKLARQTWTVPLPET
jgi:hypothetical protein